MDSGCFQSTVNFCWSKVHAYCVMSSRPPHRASVNGHRFPARRFRRFLFINRISIYFCSMVIVVDTRFAEAVGPAGDSDWGCRHFRQMARMYPQRQFVLIGSQPWPADHFTEANIVTVTAGPPANRYRLLQYWYNFRLPALLRKYKASVFVCPGNHGSLYTKVPQCLLAKDLPYRQYPKWIAKTQIRFANTNQQRFFNKASCIIATSRFCADAIAEGFAAEAEKVQVIYPGVAHVFCTASYEQQAAVREQYTAGRAYFLCVGNLLPQHNLMNLLRAFSQFKKMQKSNMQLLLAGHNLWPKNELVQSLKNYKYKRDVKLTGQLPLAEMARLMAGAYALVQPAELPGFALPPLEAMQCGVPVIVTATGALPEICGPAALYAADGSANELATQMMLIFKDETLRAEKISAGLEQVKKFEEHHAVQQLAQAIMGAAQPVV
jgi:glycosyltransferase involved in cell wall biosynthesis